MQTTPRHPQNVDSRRRSIIRRLASLAMGSALAFTGLAATWSSATTAADAGVVQAHPNGSNWY